MTCRRLIHGCRRIIVALISDYWLRDPAKIGIAIGLLSAIVVPMGVLAIWFARRLFVETVATEAEA